MLEQTEQVVVYNTLAAIKEALKKDFTDADKLKTKLTEEESELLKPVHFLTINIIGENVRYFRSLRDMTQATLATSCGIRSRSYVSQIENGALLPSLTLLVKISSTLKVSPAAMLLDPDKDDFYIWYKALLPRQRKLIHKQAQFIHIAEGTYQDVPQHKWQRKSILYKAIK